MLPVNCCRSLNIVLRDNRLRSAVVEEGGRKEQTERGFRSVVAHSSPLRLLGGAASGASAASSRARTAQAATSPSQREALQLLQRCVDAHGPSDAPTACVQSDSMRSSSMRRLSVPSEPQVCGRVFLRRGTVGHVGGISAETNSMASYATRLSRCSPPV